MMDWIRARTIGIGDRGSGIGDGGSGIVLHPLLFTRRWRQSMNAGLLPSDVDIPVCTEPVNLFQCISRTGDLSDDQKKGSLTRYR